MAFFKGRKAVIATRHKKEEVTAPIPENELGLNYIKINGLDTDSLGTAHAGDRPTVVRFCNPLKKFNIYLAIQIFR